MVDYARIGNTKRMEDLLIQHVDLDSSKDGVTALQIAVRNNHQQAVELLLRYDVSTNKTPIVKEAMNISFTEIVKVLSEGGASYGPLVTSTRDGNMEEMKKMLSFQIEHFVKNSSRLRIQKQGNKAPKMILRYGWPS